MNETPSAFPLAWPPGWPRTRYQDRKVSDFSSADTKPGPDGRKKRVSLRLIDARERLAVELERIKAKSPIISSNLELTRAGRPRADRADPRDPGVCVYFLLKGRPVSLPCDKYLTVAENMVAIGVHIRATRQIERHGVGTLEQMFTGFMALAKATPAGKPWWMVFGFEDDAQTLEVVEMAYRHQIRTAHPDAGGSHERAAELNAAIAEARRILK